MAKNNNDAKGTAAAQAELDRLVKAHDAERLKVAFLRDQIKVLEAKLKAATAAPPKPPPPPAADFDKQLAELKYQAELNRARAAELSAIEKDLAAKIAALEAARAKRDPRDLQLGRLTGAQTLDLTVGTKDAAWPFLVKETDRDGKTVGTAAFDTAAALGLYLNRSAKDPTGPKVVRINVAADSRFELVSAVLDLCKAAGLKANVVLKTATGEAPKEAADSLLKLGEAKQRVEDEAAKMKLIEVYKELMKKQRDLIKPQPPSTSAPAPKP